MSNQVQETTETPLTRRQIAARKRAAEQARINQAAKEWLAGRKGSKTPVADRLIARHIGKGESEESARENLKVCLLGRLQVQQGSGKLIRYQNDATGVYRAFRHWGISTPARRAQDAIDFLKEQGITVSEREAEHCLRNAAQEQGREWVKPAAELAAQQEAKPTKPRRRKPVQLPLIEADEPASVTVTQIAAQAETSPDAPSAIQPNLREAEKAYYAAYNACRDALRQRNRRLRAISEEKGYLNTEAQHARAAVTAEYAEPLAEAEAQLKRATGVLVRMGHPPYDGAKDDWAQEPVSREKCAVDDSSHQANSHQHATHNYRHHTTEAVSAQMPGEFVPLPAINDLSIGMINPFTQSDKKTTDSEKEQCPVRDYQKRDGQRQHKQPDTQQYQHFVPALQGQISKLFKQFFHGGRVFWMKGDACRSLHLAFKHTAPPPIPSCRRLDTARYRHRRKPRIAQPVKRWPLAA